MFLKDFKLNLDLIMTCSYFRFLRLLARFRASAKSSWTCSFFCIIRHQTEQTHNFFCVEVGFLSFLDICMERSTWILRGSTSAKYEILVSKSSRSQLYKTSKIIKIHALAFENELLKDNTVQVPCLEDLKKIRIYQRTDDLSPMAEY